MPYWMVKDCEHNRRRTWRQKLIGRIYTQNEPFPPNVYMVGVEPRPAVVEAQRAGMQAAAASQHSVPRRGFGTSPWAADAITARQARDDALDA
jgi:hypothetical protein